MSSLRGYLLSGASGAREVKYLWKQGKFFSFGFSLKYLLSNNFEFAIKMCVFIICDSDGTSCITQGALLRESYNDITIYNPPTLVPQVAYDDAHVGLTREVNEAMLKTLLA